MNGQSGSYQLTRSNGRYFYRLQDCLVNGGPGGSSTSCSFTSSKTILISTTPPSTPGSFSVPSTNHSGSYTISWAGEAGVTHYLIDEQVNGGSFSTTSQSATSKSYSGKAFGAYGYRIRACNPAGCSGYTTTKTVNVVPVMPSSISVPSLHDGDFTVSWGASSSSITKYDLDQSINGGSYTNAYDGTALSKSFSNVSAGTYKYRVRACNNTICSDWRYSGNSVAAIPASVPGSFSVSETNDTNGAYSVNWGSVANTNNYELQEKTGSGSWTTIQNTSATSKSFSGKTNNSYSYQVRACNDLGCTAFTSVQTVSVISSVPAGPPTTVTLPSTNNTGSYTLSWTSVSYISYYKIDETFVDSTTFSTIHTGNQLSLAIPAKTQSESGRYQYRVAACNVHGCSAFSSVKIIDVAIAPGVPSSITVPAIQDGDFTVSWGSASGAITKYDMDRSINGGTYTNAYDGSGLSFSYTDLAAGTYKFRVRACKTSGSYSSCSGWRYSIDSVASEPANAPPSFSASETNDTNGAYSVSWGAVANTNNYELQEKIGSGNWTTIQNTSATSKSFSGKTNENYSYQVRACNDLGCSNYSSVQTVIVISQPPSSAPTVSGPANSASGSYTLSWSSAPYASSYEYETYKNGQLMASLSGSTSSLSKAYSITQNQSGVYTFKVRACNTHGCTAWSSIHTTEVAVTPAAPTNLSAPALHDGDATLTWNTVQGFVTAYDVDKSRDSGSYSSVLYGMATSNGVTSTFDVADLEAGSYIFRIRACTTVGSTTNCSGWNYSSSSVAAAPSSTPGSFSQSETTSTDGNYDISWGTVTNANTYELQEKPGNDSWVSIQNSAGQVANINSQSNNTYSYRVRACNDLGCTPYTSAISVFVKSQVPANPPSITLPSTNNTGVYTLSWTSVPYIDFYKLDETLVNSNSFMTIHTGNQLSFPVPAKVQSESGKYQYKIAACNLHGCSAYSTIKSIDVALAPPAPASVTGSYAGSGDILVNWDQSTGLANGYKVYASFNGGPFDTLVYAGSGTSVTTEDNADGNYSYRAQACLTVGAIESCSGWTTSAQIAASMGIFDFNEDAPQEFSYGLNDISFLPDLGNPDFVALTSGSASVQRGTASYAIPVVAPPGVNGVAPKLSISYNSDAKDGLLGRGWNLSGLPKIYRCHKNMALDGASYLTGDNKSRLCLDGKRLIATNSSLGYSAEGQVYKTEHDDFTRIILMETYYNTPRYFEMQTRDGGTLTFGGNDDIQKSRSYWQNPQVTRAWSLSRYQDRYGNAFDVYYEREDGDKASTDDLRPLAILYSPGAAIHFEYTTREGHIPWGYDEGRKFVNPHILERITTYVDVTDVNSITSGTAVRKYELDYAVSTDTYRDLLQSVEECGFNNGQAQCARPLNFSYTDSEFGFESNASSLALCGGGTISGLIESANSQVGSAYDVNLDAVVDFDGDGYNDLVVMDEIYWGSSQGCYNTQSISTTLGQTYETQIHNLKSTAIGGNNSDTSVSSVKSTSVIDTPFGKALVHRTSAGKLISQKIDRDAGTQEYMQIVGSYTCNGDDDNGECDIIVTDFNRDGYTDILAGSTLYRQDSTATSLSFSTLSSNFDTSEKTGLSLFGNFDSDGFPDLIRLVPKYSDPENDWEIQGESQLSIYKSDSNGAYSLSAGFMVGGTDHYIFGGVSSPLMSAAGPVSTRLSILTVTV